MNKVELFLQELTWKKILRYSVYILPAVLALFVIYYFGPWRDSRFIHHTLKQSGWWAPVIFILLLAFTQIIAPLSVGPVFFAGYTLFTSKVQLYGYLSMMISSTISFWLARMFGRTLITRLIGEKNIAKVDRYAHHYGYQSLIFLRVFQGHLNDFVSYAYGFTDMKFLPYIGISAVAPIPWLLFWQLFIFKRIYNIKDFTFWYFVTFMPFVLLSAVFVVYKRWKQKVKI